MKQLVRLSGYSAEGFNYAPRLENNMLRIREGQTHVLDSTNLSATDNDSNDPELIFIVSELKSCRFRYTNHNDVVAYRFTQKQVLDGFIEFVHRGESAPSYRVAVSDGFITTEPVAATIIFIPVNDAPVVVREIAPQETEVGQPFSLVMDDVFIDPEGDPLTLTIKEVEEQQLKRVNWATVDDHLLRGIPDRAGDFMLNITAQDPQGASASSLFNLRVTEQNMERNPPVGAIVGGSIAGLITLLIFFFVCWRKPRKSRVSASQSGQTLFGNSAPGITPASTTTELAVVTTGNGGDDAKETVLEPPTLDLALEQRIN